MAESHFTPMDDRDIEDAVGRGMPKARRQAEIKVPRNNPNSRGARFMRRVVLPVFIGGATFFGIHELKKANDHDHLNSELTQPAGKVEAELEAGDINAGDVTKFKVGDTEYAWKIASELTHKDHQLDTGTVSSIIEAQQGNSVQAGSQVVVPNFEVDQPVEPPK